MIYRASEWVKYMTYAVVCAAIVLGIGGCNTSSKSEKTIYAADGKTPVSHEETKTSESAAVMKSMAPAIEACEVGMAERRKMAIEEAKGRSPVPQFTPEQILALKADAQAKYIGDSFSYGMVIAMTDQTKMIIAAFKKPPITCAQAVAMAVDSYMEKEGIQAKQWGSTGLALAIAVPTAWVIKTAMNTMDNAIAGQGDTISTGNISQTKSDDPYGGEGTGGDVNGSAAINIGSGNLATDHGQVPTNVDKNINTGFGNKSSSNQDNNTNGPNVINDNEDGANNDLGF